MSNLPQGMPGEGGYLLHTRIFPHDHLVEGVSMCRYDFIYILRPHEVTNLIRTQGEENEKNACIFIA